jgi:hypothetical protein
MVGDSAVIWDHAWGARGSVAVPGRYAGSNDVTLALYSPGESTWSIRQALGNQRVLLDRYSFGGWEYLPVPGDYDGDGVWDLCVMHTTTFTWSVRTVPQTPGGAPQSIMEGFQFGYGGVVPVPGDYDGDGAWDLAVFHPDSGAWHIFSPRRQEGIAWDHVFGGPGMEPVPGDYDGDGRWDLALYRRATAEWSIWSLARGQSLAQDIQYGWSVPDPVPGDFDGDGAFDLALYHRQTGNWYARNVVLGRYFMDQTGWGWEHALAVALKHPHLPIKTRGDRFLYKPRKRVAPSVYEGGLVMLPAYNAPTGSRPVNAVVLSKDPTGTDIIEPLRYTGDFGDGRPKWRWSDSADQQTFGLRFYAVAFLVAGGPPQPYMIFDGTERQE